MYSCGLNGITAGYSFNFALFTCLYIGLIFGYRKKTTTCENEVALRSPAFGKYLDGPGGLRAYDLDSEPHLETCTANRRTSEALHVVNPVPHDWRNMWHHGVATRRNYSGQNRTFFKSKAPQIIEDDPRPSQQGILSKFVYNDV